MYEAGELIVYGGVGICRVEDVGKLAHPIPGQDKNRLYYTLSPLREGGVVYTPVDTTVFMRPVMSRREAEQLLENLPQVSELELDSVDYRQLADNYRAVLHTYRMEDLLRLLKTVWLRQCRCREQKKTLGKVDRQFQQTAERFLCEELSCALGIAPDAVEAYIQQRLDAAE